MSPITEAMKPSRNSDRQSCASSGELLPKNGTAFATESPTTFVSSRPTSFGSSRRAGIQGRKGVNIHASSGVIWGIPAKECQNDQNRKRCAVQPRRAKKKKNRTGESPKRHGVSGVFIDESGTNIPSPRGRVHYF